MDSFFPWLILTLICILIQSFYSMLEMACLSFNKVRLHYYVDRGNKRAIWLNQLLQNPTKLFATTLLGVNIALQVGSECSRRFYAAINLNPDIAPITQVLLVLIFAEITPIFIARKFAENVVMIGMPIIYLSSKILAPAIWALALIPRLINRFVRSPKNQHTHYLSREELQKALEEADNTFSTAIDDDPLLENIFAFTDKKVKDLMLPLHQVHALPAFYSIRQVRHALQENYHPHLPVYSNYRNNIIGIAVCRELIRCDASTRIAEALRPPWFVTAESAVEDILKQFRHNNQKLAVVLDELGLAIGIITLEDILKDLFEIADENTSMPSHAALIEKNFPADLKVCVFNQTYGANLEEYEDETLGQLFTRHLGHPPEVGEAAIIGHYEMHLEEASLGSPKLITIKTRI